MIPKIYSLVFAEILGLSNKSPEINIASTLLFFA